MAERFEQDPILEEVWNALESLYQARTEPVYEIAYRVGMSDSGLSRAISEKRDLHASTLARLADAFGYRVQIHFVPIENITDSFHSVVVHSSEPQAKA